MHKDFRIFQARLLPNILKSHVEQNSLEELNAFPSNLTSWLIPPVVKSKYDFIQDRMQEARVKCCPRLTDLTLDSIIIKIASPSSPELVNLVTPSSTNLICLPHPENQIDSKQSLVINHSP